MNYEHELQDGIAVFSLEGSLLSESDREAIKKQLESYLDEDTVRFLIDLSELQHINSTGLGIFITLYTKVRSKNGEMVICNPSSNIDNLLKITKLETVFTITSSKEEGLQKLSGN